MKRSNEFKKEQKIIAFGEYPENYLHFIGIENEGRTDALHHILKRNRENKTLSSIFNALPVNNQTHLKYHGRLLLIENKILFLNLVALTIFRNFQYHKKNNIMFIPDKFFTEADILFIDRYKKYYTRSTLEKLKKIGLC